MFPLYPHCQQDTFIIADMSSAAGAVIRCTIMGTGDTLLTATAGAGGGRGQAKERKVIVL